jgi:hypothetical protein
VIRITKLRTYKLIKAPKIFSTFCRNFPEFGQNPSAVKNHGLRVTITLTRVQVQLQEVMDFSDYLVMSDSHKE